MSETLSYLARVKKQAASAMMAGALASSGCSNQPTEPDAPPETAQAPVPPAMPDVPAAIARYMDLGPDRLRVELELGETKVPLLVIDADGHAQERFNQTIRGLLEHAERYDAVSLIFSDARGELPVCRTSVPIPLAERTRAGVSARVALLTQDTVLGQVEQQCTRALPALRAREKGQEPAPVPQEPWTPPEGELQPIDPKHWAHREGRDLQGRVADIEGPHRA